MKDRDIKRLLGITYDKLYFLSKLDKKTFIKMLFEDVIKPIRLVDTSKEEKELRKATDKNYVFKPNFITRLFKRFNCFFLGHRWIIQEWHPLDKEGQKLFKDVGMFNKCEKCGKVSMLYPKIPKDDAELKEGEVKNGN